MISIRQVWMEYPIPKRYRDLLLRPLARRKIFTALKEVTLEFEKRERVGLLGPNGAGKTTLLKLISGLLLPSRGEILVDNHNTVHNNREVRKTVGFVMNEERSFFWRLNAMQNLEFFGTLDNMRGERLRERCREVLGFVGLDNVGDKMVSKFSSGMKQRLAMARGLIAHPDILILDEPTRALDPLAAEELTDLILEKILTHRERSLLIATHRLDEAEKLCSRILIVNEGRIVSNVKLDDLKSRGVSLTDHYKNCVKTAE